MCFRKGRSTNQKAAIWQHAKGKIYATRAHTRPKHPFSLSRDFSQNSSGFLHLVWEKRPLTIQIRIIQFKLNRTCALALVRIWKLIEEWSGVGEGKWYVMKRITMPTALPHPQSPFWKMLFPFSKEHLRLNACWCMRPGPNPFCLSEICLVGMKCLVLDWLMISFSFLQNETFQRIPNPK